MEIQTKRDSRGICSRWRNKIKLHEKQLSEVETGNLPEKEFTIMITKMTQEHKKQMDVQSEKL